MSSNSGLLRGVVALAILLALLLPTGCWSRSNSQQTFVTAASIQAAVTSDFDAQIAALAPVTNHWKILTDAEYDALILRVSKLRELSGPPDWRPGMILSDAWGHRFHVAIKRDDLVVWSNGPDALPNTPDDIISPHEFHEKLPTSNPS